MDYIKIAQLAATREQLPDTEPVCARALYWRLRCLYAEYERGLISKEYGAQEKQRAFRLYDQDEADAAMKMRLVDSSTKLWRSVEHVSSDYANNRTLDNADRLWAAVVNLPEGSRPKNAGKH